MISSNGTIRKIIGWSIIIVNGLVLIAAMLWTILYAANSASEDVFFEATAQNNVNFEVHYLDNEIFGENPVSANLHFLRPFTDFIEFESSFSASFSENLDVNYTYIAEKRLVITHSGGGGNVNDIFEENTELSRIHGSASGRKLDFRSDSEDGEPGGTYTIFPREYMETFLNFLEYHDQHTEGEGGSVSSFRGFSAHLFIEFTYYVASASVGLYETTKRGYSIPISLDVFAPEPIGDTGFSTSIILDTAVSIISPIDIAFFALSVILSSLGAFMVIKSFSVDDNEHRKKAETILKKFSGEIVVSKNPMNLSRYSIMMVDEFEEILKLSVNLNKHIMCYHNAHKMELCTIVDEYAYYYCINYNGEESNFNIESVNLEQFVNNGPAPHEIKLISGLLYEDIGMDINKAKRKTSS